ncbi:MAG: PPOX class F420-dependent oxidoreductase [Nitrososphaera sp.]
MPEQAARLFQEPNFGFLATIMEDGSPQVSPVWVDIDIANGLVLVNSAYGRVKIKNLARDPRVAISVADRTNPYTMVTVRVVEQTTEGADSHIDLMAKKYLGADKYPFRAPGEKRVLLKIKPEKVSFTPPRH